MKRWATCYECRRKRTVNESGVCWECRKSDELSRHRQSWLGGGFAVLLLALCIFAVLHHWDPRHRDTTPVELR